jgi:hypothetical protein
MENLELFYQKYCKSTYKYPTIPPNTDEFSWIVGASKTPYLKLSIEGPWAQILAEIKRLDHLFVPHRDDSQTQGWSSLCLHGLGFDKTDTPYMYPEFRNIPDNELPWDWTEISEQCPITTDYFKNKFPYNKYFRLRFMKLDAGGFINPHTDGTSFNMGAVNISLNNPVGCEMVLRDVGVVPFEDTGSVFAFNNSYDHLVWNQSQEARYHMIVHGQWNYNWSQIVVDSYNHQLTL